MAWYYNVTYNSTPPTANDYHWFGLNTSNQEAAIIYLNGNQAVSHVRVYAAARSSAVLTRLAIWDASGNVIAQTASFSMGTGSDAVGGQSWQEVALTSPVYISGGNYFIGLYRNPSGSHLGGTHTSEDSYLKTNTNGFPSIASMSGYTAETNEGLMVGVYALLPPNDITNQAVSRNSDYSQTVSFTNNAAADRPYDGILLHRWDNVTNGWYYFTTLSGSATNYTDTTTIADRRYQYALRAYNTAGNANWAYTDLINTTPANPTNVVAASSGTSVVITWTDNSSNENHFYIQSSEYTGGAWQAWVNEVEVAAGTVSWTDTTPPNIVKYRVKALTDTYGSLSSVYAESNELTILQAPSAPTGMVPDNVYIDGADANIFMWTHNPLDGSAQTKYSIQYKVSGGSYPGTPQASEVASSVSSKTWAAATFTNGTTYKYQVKTWGAYSTGSAWSAEKTFYAAAKPVAVITSPTVADDYAVSTLTLTWEFTGTLQTEYLAKLYDDADNLLETQLAASAATSVVFTTLLGNAETYTITLQVKDSTLLWSTETEVEFNTVFGVPPTPTFTLTASESTGSVQIAITNPSPQGAEVEAATNNVYRSIDGNVTYEKFLTDVPLNTTVTDYLPILGSLTYYYVESVSAAPYTVAASVASTIQLYCTGYYFLNSGDGYADYLSLYKNVAVGENPNRITVLNKFKGRTYPVKFQGDEINQEINFSCMITYSELNDARDFVEYLGDFFFRDYTGRWYSCALINPQFTKQKKGLNYTFSCNIIRVEGDD